MRSLLQDAAEALMNRVRRSGDDGRDILRVSEVHAVDPMWRVPEQECLLSFRDQVWGFWMKVGDIWTEVSVRELPPGFVLDAEVLLSRQR